MKILVVEDNQVNQLMAQGTLGAAGFQVDLASDGSEAVSLTESTDFDVILMDLVMPVMDGYQASEAILARCRQEGKAEPLIVAVTATLTEDDKVRCKKAGMLHWLNKPIDPEEFQKLVSEVGKPSSEPDASPAPDSPSSTEATSPAPEPATSTPGNSAVSGSELLNRVKDPAALKHIVDLYSESYPQRLEELRSSLDPEHSVTARRAAHTLKGNFLNFASPTGARAAQDVEHAIEQGDWSEVRRLLPNLESECRAVEEALLALVQSAHGHKAPDTTGDQPGPGSGFTVLVADVDPANRALCVAALTSDGYSVLEASDGLQVLKLLETESVDVVMLSVFMSQLGGFDTCRRIKSNEATGMIPVLLVTAMDERGARLNGMDAGADDFITKPIDPREVSLRVRNAARGKALYDQVQANFVELQQLEKLRDGLTHMLVHDLRTPLTAIKGYASLLQAGFGQSLTPQQKTFAEKIVLQSNRLVEMVSAILDVSRLESDQMPLNLDKCDLSLLLYEQAEQFSGLPDHLLELKIADSLFLKCDGDLIKRVVANLLSNAFKYTPKEESVVLELVTEGKFAKVSVIDKGPGVPVEARERIFEKFSQVEGETHKRPYSSGLGLTFCQLVVQKHGGEIAVDDGLEGKGSRFWFTVPLS